MSKLNQEQAHSLLQKRLIELDCQKLEVTRLAAIALAANVARDKAREHLAELSKDVDAAQAELDAFAEKAVLVRSFRHHAPERITVVIADRTPEAIFVRAIGVHGAKLIQFRLSKGGAPVWREFPEPSGLSRVPVQLEPVEGGKL